MNAKDIRDMVSDVHIWGGNAFTLAMKVMEKQREDDALIAESLEHSDVAEAIRAAP